ncbi:MAG: HAD-IIB family hydrolase [Clostridia bacterium]|nr:HAD-IIB family hydrolase [Clostridia bacterium]
MGIKLIAFDLDGTLTEHRTKLSDEHREILERLSQKYKLIMVGAGQCRRIFEQMNRFPIDIIGNYGMQYAKFVPEKEDIEMVYDAKEDCDKEACERKVTYLREKYGFKEFAGDNVEFHASGCVTFPILGTKANIEDKVKFDPDRKKRRAFYPEVKELFSDYNVFVGGSSSFDMAPKPYDKYFALDRYCRENGYLHSETVFVGDDFGEGGNDESVYLSDFNFIKVDSYKNFKNLIKDLL